MGHTAKFCKEERVVVDRVEVKCVNCKQPGHRARDCTEKRVDRFACRNCGYASHSRPFREAGALTGFLSRSPDHRATDCPEPRSAEGVECKKCNEGSLTPEDHIYAVLTQASVVGHFAKDCPQGGGPKTCRNCGLV